MTIEQPMKPKIALCVQSHEAIAYMNRAAIYDLIAELTNIANAPPEECYHVHFGWHFSHFDERDERVRPDVVFADELAAEMQDRRSENFEIAKSTDPDLHDSELCPFEMTIMHVSDAMISDVKKFSVR